MSIPSMRFFSLAAALLVLCWSTITEAASCPAGLLIRMTALLSDWRDDKPGLCRLIRPEDLPRPRPAIRASPTSSRAHRMLGQQCHPGSA